MCSIQSFSGGFVQYSLSPCLVKSIEIQLIMLNLRRFHSITPPPLLRPLRFRLLRVGERQTQQGNRETIHGTMALWVAPRQLPFQSTGPVLPPQLCAENCTRKFPHGSKGQMLFRIWRPHGPAWPSSHPLEQPQLPRAQRHLGPGTQKGQKNNKNIFISDPGA